MRYVGCLRGCISISIVLGLTACAGGEDDSSGRRIITNTQPTGNSSNTTLPGCEEYTKGLDTDADSLKDYDEFVGTPLAGTSVGYRTNPFAADTDGDGKSDLEEISGLRKVDGLAIDNLLKSPYITDPIHRDFILMIHAQGGENSQRIYNASNRNGWNIFSGLGSTDAGKEGTRFMRMASETELKVTNLSLDAIDRAILGADKTAWLPNKCQSNTADNDCNCHQGEANPNAQEGCTNFSGLRFSNNGRGPQQNCTGAPFYECANNGFRNSIVGRFTAQADRYANFVGLESFRIGSIGDINGSPGQATTSGGGSVPVEYLSDFSWKLTLSGAQDNLHLMFRIQDTNAGTSDNSGFSTVNARFINTDPSYTSKYAAFSNDNERTAKLDEFYKLPVYSGKCQVPTN